MRGLILKQRSIPFLLRLVSSQGCCLTAQDCSMLQMPLVQNRSRFKGLMKLPPRAVTAYQKAFILKVLQHNVLTKALIAGRAPHLNANHTALNEEQMHYTLSNELQAQGSNE